MNMRPLVPVLASLLAAAVALPCTAQSAHDEPDEVRVWVNPRSGVYHCPGTPPYGTTTRGSYMIEADARAKKYRPAGGRECGSLAAPQQQGILTLAGKPAERPASFTAILRDSAAPQLPIGTMERCLVVRISDGDGIECQSQGRIRLIGVDAPESDQAPFGTSAHAALASLAPVGTELRLESDVELLDRYNRRLAYLWSDSVMINWMMVRLGWSVAFPYGYTTRYRTAFAAAEVLARAEARGLWAVGGFKCLPSERRGRRC